MGLEQRDGGDRVKRDTSALAGLVTGLPLAMAQAIKILAPSARSLVRWLVAAIAFVQ